jgi:hypothetical protein
MRSISSNRRWLHQGWDHSKAFIGYSKADGDAKSFIVPCVRKEAAARTRRTLRMCAARPRRKVMFMSLAPKLCGRRQTKAVVGFNRSSALLYRKVVGQTETCRSTAQSQIRGCHWLA